MSEILNDPTVITFTDTTALGSVPVYAVFGFVPRKVRVINVTETSYPEVVWDGTMDDVTAIAGGIMTSVVGGSPTRTALVAADGVSAYSGGLKVKRNNPQTPTYQDIDGNAIVVGQIHDLEGDVLARDLPALASGLSDDGKIITLGAGVKIGVNSTLRGNSQVIRVEGYR